MTNASEAVDSLLTALRAYDPAATSIAASDTCEWIRYKHGIVGLIHLPPDIDTNTTRSTVRSAYILLDAAPADAVSTEDLWNVLLFIRVPWSARQLAGRPDVAETFAAISEDTQGSRKVVLYEGDQLAAHVGPLHAADEASPVALASPVRAELRRMARSDSEFDATLLLLGKRLSSDDIDMIVRCFGEVNDD